MLAIGASKPAQVRGRAGRHKSQTHRRGRAPALAEFEVHHAAGRHRKQSVTYMLHYDVPSLSFGPSQLHQGQGGCSSPLPEARGALHVCHDDGHLLGDEAQLLCQPLLKGAGRLSASQTLPSPTCSVLTRGIRLTLLDRTCHAQTASYGFTMARLHGQAQRHKQGCL